MNIIIVGCGEVGETLAGQLNREGNNVTVVDINSEKVKEVANKYDIMGVIGNGASRSTQKDAGIDKTDLLIAVTGTDEVNLLCCLVARKSTNCRTIARLKNPEYNIDAHYFKDELGLSMVVNPEYAAAREISRILNFPSVIKIDTFAKGRVELLTFKLPDGSPLAGMSVKDASAKLKLNVTFCTIQRDEEAFIAKGDFVFAERDVISFIASPKMAKEFFTKINYHIQPIKDALIVGGGEISHYLCEILCRSGISVTIVEKNLSRCNDLAVEFEDITVVNGDPADEDTLREEGISKASSFVALTEVDEENILLSLFAKKEQSRKVITKINKNEYYNIVNNLDLDTIIYPKNITADMIIRYVRAMNNTRGSNIETLYNIIKGKVEAAEFTVSEDSPIVGKPLSQLTFKPNVLIASILREKVQIAPRGQAIIEPGDAVVVVTKDIALGDITDILK